MIFSSLTFFKPSVAGVSDFCSVEYKLKSCCISPFTAIQQPFYAPSTFYIITAPFASLLIFQQNMVFLEFQVVPWESWSSRVTLSALCITVHGFLEFSGGPLGELVQWSDLICTLYLLGHDLTITSETEQLQRLV